MNKEKKCNKNSTARTFCTQNKDTETKLPTQVEREIEINVYYSSIRNDTFFGVLYIQIDLFGC